MDVARASGFSASTVSIVLNEAPLSRYVAAGTKERIRAVAGDLGYRPDASARSLRSRRSHTIGIMVSDISDPFCTLILQGIEKALQPTTYLPVIMIAHNRREQFERHIELMLERRVEGLVLVANWLFGEFDLLAEIEKNQIPTIGVGRDLTASGIRSLQVDNEAGRARSRPGTAMSSATARLSFCAALRSSPTATVAGRASNVSPARLGYRSRLGGSPNLRLLSIPPRVSKKASGLPRR